jgi:hypothetical protein
METTTIDGALVTVTPFDLKVITHATLYDVWCVVLSLRGKVIYKKQNKIFNSTADKVATLHQSAVCDFMQLAKNNDLRKPLNF